MKEELTRKPVADEVITVKKNGAAQVYTDLGGTVFQTDICPIGLFGISTATSFDTA